jgi:hypothetical protein
MQKLKVQALFIAASVLLTCAACSNEPKEKFADHYRATFEGTISVLEANGSGATTLYKPRLAGIGGQTASAGQTETTTIGEPTLLTVGNVTTTESETVSYGYALFVTPESEFDQDFSGTKKVRTSIKLDHGVKLSDGRASHQIVTGESDLAEGDSTILRWKNQGKSYELALRLAAIVPTYDAIK